MSGDYMPSNTQQIVSNRTEYVQTTLWIFSARIPSTGSPRWPVAEAAHHPNLVCLVKSDPSGDYAIALPPGEYTVFAQEGDSLYLNTFQSDGSFSSVEVMSDQFVQLDLINTENAVF
jgi:hypothetical protein